MLKKDLKVVEGRGRQEIKPLLDQHHYLSSVGGFRVGINYTLEHPDLGVVGVCIFTSFPVPELVVGCFGLGREEQEGMFELSRLCLDPRVQSEVHNCASWFVAQCLRRLRKGRLVRAVLSYADSDYHKGTVYRALGFKYYGLSAPRKDFWVLQDDGSYKKHTRGPTRGLEGEWRPRSRKHRYLIVYDPTLQVKWKEER